jgi:hypothetical protein
MYVVGVNGSHWPPISEPEIAVTRRPSIELRHVHDATRLKQVGTTLHCFSESRPVMPVLPLIAAWRDWRVVVGPHPSSAIRGTSAHRPTGWSEGIADPA